MFTSVGDTSAEFGKLNSRLYHRVGWEKRSYGRVELTTEGAALLQERKNLKVRIVSVPSEGLFRMQDREYQDSVLPPGIPRFGLTAGLPVNLSGLVGEKGRIWGLEHFGYSAPYKVLDEKFGFTGENVYKQLTEFLSH